MIPNYHILTVKHIPQTNFKAAGVKITSERFNQSIVVPYTNDPGSCSTAIDSAVNYLKGRGWIIIGKGEGKNHMYLVTDTRTEEGAFEPLKPIK